MINLLQKILKRLTYSFLRNFRPYRGGIGFNANMATMLTAFYPNSGNWQKIAKEVFIGTNKFPQQLLDIRSVFAQKIGGGINTLNNVPQNTELAARLEFLFEEYGSDKARHGYHLLYGGLLSVPMADTSSTPIHILEIGIGSQNPNAVSTMAWASSRIGGSLKGFTALSPRIQVLGFDNDWDSLISDERIQTRFVDQLIPESFSKALKDFPNMAFDLIIDDGLHFITANLNSIIELLPRLKTFGFMVIEDIPERSEALWMLVAAALNDSGFRTCIWSHGKGGFNFVIQKYQ